MNKSQITVKQKLRKGGMKNGDEINWTQEQMLEVTLNEPDDFLKVRETLSRIGVASRKERTLYQSCYILHRRKYFHNTLRRCLQSTENKQI